MIKVLLALPSYRPADQRAWLCIADLMVLLTVSRVPWSRVHLQQCAWLDHTHNFMVHRLMTSNATHLFTIDDDIQFDPQEALRMLQRGADCVGGDYPLKAFGSRMVCERDTAKGPSGELLPCKTIGLGFSVISKTAIERIIADNQETAFVREAKDPDEGQISYSLFESVRIDGRRLDPDVVFFARMRAAGITPWLDTAVSLGHIGTHVYTPKDVNG